MFNIKFLGDDFVNFSHSFLPVQLFLCIKDNPSYDQSILPRKKNNP